MLKTIALLLLTLSLSLGCATTREPERLASPEDPFAMPIDEFIEEQQILRANLEAGNPRSLDEKEWQRLNRIHQNIDQLIGQARTIEEVDLENRYTLFQLRNQLIAMLVGGAADDVVCFRQQSTGTRLGGGRRCMTRAELEQSRFRTEYLMEFIRQQNTPLEAQ